LALAGYPSSNYFDGLTWNDLEKSYLNCSGERMSDYQHKPVEADQARKDHLWPQIASLPYFRGLLRAVEARFYENIELPAPTLDLWLWRWSFCFSRFSAPVGGRS